MTYPPSLICAARGSSPDLAAAAAPVGRFDHTAGLAAHAVSGIALKLHALPGVSGGCRRPRQLTGVTLPPDRARATCHDGPVIAIRPPEDWRTLTDEEQKDWVRALFAEVLVEE